MLVHGDASYLYHTPDGAAHQADEETLREAFAAARSMPQAEVFIVHQRPQDPLLGLFPRDDGTLYHFRRGRLQHRTTYKRTPDSTFAGAAAFLRQYRSSTPDSTLLTTALYYGHAVPERPRPGYHRSHRDVPFGIDDLARGLEQLTTADAFDAVVLSTCDGGTPHTVAALAPYARSLLASPSDLHLSFLDADLLSTLPIASPSAWTARFAKRAHNRLVNRVTTAVTLATYDMDRVVSTARGPTRTARPDTSTTPTGGRHVDCRRVLDAAVDTSGVRVWHRPARFGPQADHTTHSGWGCHTSE
ncbi:MAG: hypothetical protein BRD55_08380 [Bacteroidetes bacterium SW_9_63_38]|nr:MAG: hypothetical protein BRD55_08380 [Bacteroidetes bacterium SW_9_63_38]